MLTSMWSHDMAKRRYELNAKKVITATMRVRFLMRMTMMIDTIQIRGPTMLRRGSCSADQCKDTNIRWSRHCSMTPVRTPVLWSRLTETRSTS